MRSLRSVLIYLKNPNKDIYDRPRYNSEHLGICYLGAALRQAGFPVSFINGAGEGLSSDQVLARIRLSKADFIGFSVTCATIGDALHISRQLKAEMSNVHICLGGHHASFAAREILENEDCVDSVVRGDGEVTIVELLRALEAKYSLEGIQGVYYRDGDGKVCMNKDRPIVHNLDVLLYPARDVLEMSISQGRADQVQVCSSRGCPRKCRFCSTPEYYKLQGGSYWRARSAVNVVHEIQLVCEKYGLNKFSFVDDNFVLPTHESKERLYEIANEILRRGLKIGWFMLCSVLVFGPGDEELLSLSRTAGLDEIFLGIEAGYQPTLDFYQKPATPERNLRAVDFLSEFGFFLTCSTILFHPYATTEELRVNSRFFKHLMDKPTVGMFAPYCRRLEVYRGMGIFDEMERDGLSLSNKSYLDAYAYNFVSPTVQLLADTMWDVLPIVVGTDWLICDTRRLLLSPINSEKQSESQIPAFDQIGEKCESIIRDINKINFDFFTLALDLAGRGDQLTLEREHAEYVRQLKARDALLREHTDLMDAPMPRSL